MRAAATDPDPSPVTVRRYAGCLLMEVREEIGPAAEPHLGRLLHAAIRPGDTAVLVDLRHTGSLGSGGVNVLELARTLADRRGMPFGFVDDAPSAPALPGEARQPTARPAEVSSGGFGEGRPHPNHGPSALPPSRRRGRP
ncbi:hypothetical protein [Streptomyces sp. NBC_01451]|uniref:hypothetical protein n=1 Tax=Streptomyces sp. NBC_01451 TaxID=2903872 RepID=UPI002E315DD9|nr:hypothetical protein [Streptomyces sp. NBC_01451]